MSVSESVSAVRSAADAARKVGFSAVDAVGRWNDPRRKHLRRMRRARRRGSWLGSASAVSGVSTAGLAVGSAPEWTYIATGGTAAFLAVPAVLAFGTFRRLKSQPLPAAKPVKASLPPASSAAYEPMKRLHGGERSLYELLGILSRSGSVDPAEVADTADVAAAAVETLTVRSSDIVAMERAADASPTAREHLAKAILGAADELSSGVDQYEALVAAAARVTAPNNVHTRAVGGRTSELLAATDRLEGWASALTELDAVRRPHTSG